MPSTEPHPSRPALHPKPAPAGAAPGGSSWLRMVTVASLLAGCSSPMPPYQAPAPAPLRPPASPGSTGPEATGPGSAPALQPPREARSWVEYRRQAAERIAAASPQASYLGPPPDVLLAIPVLEVELNADGSVRRIDVLRHPKQALDTTQLAIDAVRRAAPFGSVARLPRPWKFTETFLFDDARRFKPRTLD